MAVKTFLFFCFCRGGSPQACGPDLVQLRSACGVLEYRNPNNKV